MILFSYKVLLRTGGKLNRGNRYLIISLVILIATQIVQEFYYLGYLKVASGRLIIEILELIFLLFLILGTWLLNKCVDEVCRTKKIKKK